MMKFGPFRRQVIWKGRPNGYEIAMLLPNKLLAVINEAVCGRHSLSYERDYEQDHKRDSKRRCHW